jgi:hypothetical protein
MKLKKIKTGALIVTSAGAILGALCYCIYGLSMYFVLILISLYLNIDCINQMTIWLVTGPLLIFLITGQYLLARNVISEREKTELLIGIKSFTIGFFLWLIVMLLTYLFNVEFVSIRNPSIITVLGYSVMSIISIISVFYWRIHTKITVE